MYISDVIAQKGKAASKELDDLKKAFNIKSNFAGQDVRDFKKMEEQASQIDETNTDIQVDLKNLDDEMSKLNVQRSGEIAQTKLDFIQKYNSEIKDEVKLFEINDDKLKKELEENINLIKSAANVLNNNKEVYVTKDYKNQYEVLKVNCEWLKKIKVIEDKLDKVYEQTKERLESKKYDWVQKNTEHNR